MTTEKKPARRRKKVRKSPGDTNTAPRRSRPSSGKPTVSDESLNGAVIEIPGLPRAEGPCVALKTGEGTKAYRQDDGEFVSVELTKGQFLWLWEVSESRARHHYGKYENWLPDVSLAATEVVKAMRRTGHAAFGFEKPEPVRRKNRVKSASADSTSGKSPVRRRKRKPKLQSPD